MLIEHAEAAAERAHDAWGASTTGRQVLARPEGRDLGRASREFRAVAERVVRDWQQAVVELVRAEGQSKRTTARFLAFGVNGLAVALMVVVFVSTAGMTGAEVGIAGGSAVLGQKLLEAVFGDQAVRRLTELSRRDLEERVRAAYDVELRALGRRARRARGGRRGAASGWTRRSRAVESARGPERREPHRGREAADRPRDPTCPARLAALREAVEATEGRLDPDLLARAGSVLERAEGRLALAGDHTVVALAGATGSGKSSLFNALAGSSLSQVGVRRPTTSATTAARLGRGRRGARLAAGAAAPPGR